MLTDSATSQVLLGDKSRYSSSAFRKISGSAFSKVSALNHHYTKKRWIKQSQTNTAALKYIKSPRLKKECLFLHSVRFSLGSVTPLSNLPHVRLQISYSISWNGAVVIDCCYEENYLLFMQNWSDQGLCEKVGSHSKKKKKKSSPQFF